MAGLVLYSTNPWIKFHIQQRWRGDVHYVWCSEVSDSTKALPGSVHSLVPATSNPVQIYRDLADACSRGDRHNEKIRLIRRNYIARAASWVSDGSLKPEERDELVAMINSTEIRIWRPLLYIIPRQNVGDRVELGADGDVTTTYPGGGGQHLQDPYDISWQVTRFGIQGRRPERARAQFMLKICRVQPAPFSRSFSHRGPVELSRLALLRRNALCSPCHHLRCGNSSSADLRRSIFETPCKALGKAPP